MYAWTKRRYCLTRRRVVVPTDDWLIRGLSTLARCRQVSPIDGLLTNVARQPVAPSQVGGMWRQDCLSLETAAKTRPRWSLNRTVRKRVLIRKTKSSQYDYWKDTWVVIVNDISYIIISENSGKVNRVVGHGQSKIHESYMENLYLRTY